MKYNLALYCKTYRNDFTRFEELWKTINKHNKDNLPFFISAPAGDKKLLEKRIGTEGYTFIPDEDIYVPSNFMEGWVTQMFIKIQAWEHIPANNILLLDSDTFFIKDFYEEDFIAYDDVPYTIIHENLHIAELESALLDKDYRKSGYATAVKAYRDLFGGKSNRIYDYGPNPHLWSRKVLQHFKTNYLDYYGYTMEQFGIAVNHQYKIHFRETLTYGEYLLATRPIDIVPCGPLFKCYHWKEQYDFELRNGLVDMEKHKLNYLGVVLQSNWT